MTEVTISIEEMVVEMWIEGGESIRDIAEELDLTKSEVRKILKINGCTK